MVWPLKHYILDCVYKNAKLIITIKWFSNRSNIFWHSLTDGMRNIDTKDNIKMTSILLNLCVSYCICQFVILSLFLLNFFTNSISEKKNHYILPSSYTQKENGRIKYEYTTNSWGGSGELNFEHGGDTTRAYKLIRVFGIEFICAVV